MFGEVKTFDWLTLSLTALTVVLLVYQIVSDQCRRKAAARKNFLLNEKALTLSLLLDRGRRLQKTVLDEVITSDYQSVNKWVQDVNEWIKQTCLILTDQPKALESFMQIEGYERVNTYVDFSGRGFWVTRCSQLPYQKLVVYLENLRRIIEIPEAYLIV